MTILVAYASKHGSTQGIAQRLAEKLRELGKQAEARPVDEVSDLVGDLPITMGMCDAEQKRQEGVQ